MRMNLRQMTYNIISSSTRGQGTGLSVPCRRTNPSSMPTHIGLDYINTIHTYSYYTKQVNKASVGTRLGCEKPFGMKYIFYTANTDRNE